MPSAEERQLLGLLHGYKISRALQVITELGVPDALAAAPRTSAELATWCRVDQDFLHQLLVVLAAVGVLEIVAGDGQEPERFGVTAVGRLLQAGSDHRRLATGPAPERSWQLWSRLPDAVRTGRPAFEAVTGRTFFDFLDANDDDARQFYERTARANRSYFAAVAWAYEFGRGTIVDVGGGLGGLLTAILDFHPDARGILFDRPEVIERLTAAPVAPSLAERGTFVAGDFFEEVPADGDVYVLCTVVNDWDDDRAADLLSRVRDAMTPSSRLLVVEEIFGPDAPLEFLLENVQRQLVFGGRMRRPAEHAALLARAGLRVISTIPTWSTLSILEVGPAAD